MSWYVAVGYNGAWDMMVFCMCWHGVFFFKQKTAYEMRISDWSSDVCSSDLRFLQQRRVDRGGHVVTGLFQDVADALVGRGQRLGLGQPGEGADGVDAAVEVVQRGRAQLGDGVEVLHRHALVGVVAAEAVEDEVVEFQ